LFLSFLDLFSFALWKGGGGVRRSEFVAKRADLDIVVNGLANATGLVIIDDAGHGSRVRGNDIGRGEMKGLSREGVKRRERGMYHES
jgi:hypothetical protein